MNTINPALNMDSKENALEKACLISKFYETTKVKCQQESPKFHTQIDDQKMMQRFLPKQADLEKILKIIQKKVSKVCNCQSP